MAKTGAMAPMIGPLAPASLKAALTPKATSKPKVAAVKPVLAAKSITGAIASPLALSKSVKPAKAPTVSLPKGVTVSPGVARQLQAEQHIKQTGPSLGTVVSRLPGEALADIQGAQKTVTNAARTGIRDVVGGAGTLADRAIRSIAGHAIDQPGNRGLQRQAGRAVVADIPKELQGTGAVEKGLVQGGALASRAITTAQKALGGGRRTQVQAAGFGTPQALNLAANIGKDAVDLPAEVIPSTYYTARAGVQAAEGNPGPAIQMGKQVLGSLTSAKGWEQHPLNNALMVSGGLSALTRAGYGAADVAGLTDRTKLVRPSERLYGNAVTQRMPYSRDPLIRARQKLADSNDLPLAGKIPGRTTFAARVGRKVDEVYGTNATRWRNERTRIDAERQAAVTRGHSVPAQVRQLARNAKDPLAPLVHPEITGKEGVNLILQGAIRRPGTVGADLQNLIDMVSAHTYEKGSAAEKAQADTLGRLQALKNDKQFVNHPAAAFGAASKAAVDLAKEQKNLVQRGYITQEQTDHARLVPYAVSHMGATRDVTAEARAHDQAKADVVTAQAKLNAAVKQIAAAPAEEAGGFAHVQALQKTLEDAQHKESVLAVPPAERNALVHPDTGARVTDEEIRAHMKANGVDPDKVGFVSHRLGTVAQAKWGSLTRQALAETKERTGEAFRGGLTDISHDQVVRQHERSALITHRHDSTQRLINTFVLRKLDPFSDFDRDQAVRAADDQEFRAAHGVPDGVKLQPFRMAPQFARRGQITAIKAGLVSPIESLLGGEDNADTLPIARRDYTPVGDAVKAEGPGSYGLIADDAAHRLIQHEAPANAMGRLARSSSSLFRGATLPFSPHRVVGLPQETALRLAVGRAGLTSRIFGGRLLKTLGSEDFQAGTPEAKDYLDGLTARALGGQQSGQALRLKTYNGPDYYRGTIFEGGAKVLQNVKGTPGIGHVMAAFKTVSNSILHWQRQAVEVQAGRTALGKAALLQLKQDTGYGWPRALVLQQKAVEDFAKGLVNTKSQDTFGRYVDTMMGKWSNNSPLMTSALRASPFLSWYTNSLKFLYGTLPHEHPVITGLLAAANTATTGQRAAVGMSGPLSGNPGEIEGYEEGGVPFGGKVLDLAHYSPFGAVSDLAGAPLSELPPITIAAAQGLAGLNYEWEYPKAANGLREEPPTAQKFQLAFESLLDTIMPGVSVAERGATEPSSFLKPFAIYKPYAIAPTSSSLTGGSLTGGSLTGGSLTGGPLK